jgi:hypothetical protein
MKSEHLTSAVALSGALAPGIAPGQLKIDDPGELRWAANLQDLLADGPTASIKGVTRTLAAQTMVYYPGTATVSLCATCSTCTPG